MKYKIGKNCKGCNVMKGTITICFFNRYRNIYHKIEKCPCVQCLVKVMCKKSCYKRDLAKFFSSNLSSLGETGYE